MFGALGDHALPFILVEVHEAPLTEMLLDSGGAGGDDDFFLGFPAEEVGLGAGVAVVGEVVGAWRRGSTGEVACISSIMRSSLLS